jgi:DNA-binding NarL/FixJ family response regulator
MSVTLIRRPVPIPAAVTFYPMPQTYTPDGLDLLLANPTCFQPMWARAGRAFLAWNQLTDDQRRVVILLVHGRLYSQISPALHVTPSEAEKLITSALARLDIRSIAELCELHASAGFTRPEQL